MGNFKGEEHDSSEFEFIKSFEINHGIVFGHFEFKNEKSSDKPGRKQEN